MNTPSHHRVHHGRNARYLDANYAGVPGSVGDFGWGGMASTHYWVSPKDELVVVTMEQTLPYNSNMEETLKPIIYNAIID